MTSEERPSKSARKRQSDDLQALGEALIGLSQSELDALPLPEQLREAVMLARRITAHGGLYRQKQYIGKLMRKIDAEPIRAALAAKHERERLASMRFHRLEHWRERLIKESAAGIEAFLAETRANADARALQNLVEEARREQQNGSPPRASRELFRLLRDALGEQTTDSSG